MAAVLLSDVSGLQRVLARTPQQSDLSFGMSVVPLKIADMAGAHPAMAAVRAVGLVMFVLAFSAIWLVMRSSSWASSPHRSKGSRPLSMTSPRWSWWSVGAGVFVVAYLFGASWDYRLMFLGIFLAGSARVAATVRAARWLMAVVLTLMFVRYPLGRLQYAADVAWLAVAPFLAVLLVRLLAATHAVRRATRSSAMTTAPLEPMNTGPQPP